MTSESILYYNIHSLRWIHTIAFGPTFASVLKVTKMRPNVGENTFRGRKNLVQIGGGGMVESGEKWKQVGKRSYKWGKVVKDAEKWRKLEKVVKSGEKW